MKKYFCKKSLILLVLFCASCSHQDKKKDEFQVDQEIIDSNSMVSFARAHYLLADSVALNKSFEKKMSQHIREYCEDRELHKKILRHYSTQTDFVTLRIDYRYNRKVKVYEFQCIP